MTEDIFHESPIIAAVNSDTLLEKAMECDIDVTFILYGSILSLPGIVENLKSSGKTVIVHTDLITGLSSKDIAVDYIKEKTRADGIITTKPNLLRRAKELDLIAGERSFLVDSMALNATISRLKSFRPDFLEVMPGLIPRVIRELSSFGVPIVAGGLISTRSEIMEALNAGASAISSTSPEIWMM
ncbi:MAG: glycerol-3-phosphate responsive antiterminator [Candidatus Ornithospirochaeta sp.]